MMKRHKKGRARKRRGVTRKRKLQGPPSSFTLFDENKRLVLAALERLDPKIKSQLLTGAWDKDTIQVAPTSHAHEQMLTELKSSRRETSFWKARSQELTSQLAGAVGGKAATVAVDTEQQISMLRERVARLERSLEERGL